jgi:hypothetical protein
VGDELGLNTEPFCERQPQNDGDASVGASRFVLDGELRRGCGRYGDGDTKFSGRGELLRNGGIDHRYELQKEQGMN